VADHIGARVGHESIIPNPKARLVDQVREGITEVDGWEITSQ